MTEYGSTDVSTELDGDAVVIPGGGTAYSGITRTPGLGALGSDRGSKLHTLD